MAKKINKEVSLEKSFKDMDDMERRIFLTYVSEHLLHYDSHFKEMVDILTKWENTNPIPSRLEYTIHETLN
jgi:hypothetical protein